MFVVGERHQAPGQAKGALNMLKRNSTSAFRKVQERCCKLAVNGSTRQTAVASAWPATALYIIDTIPMFVNGGTAANEVMTMRGGEGERR